MRSIVVDKITIAEIMPISQAIFRGTSSHHPCYRSPGWGDTQMRKGEYVARAQRFLTGEFRVDDLNSLFLYLRGHSWGNETVRDIGNMLGHADARKYGISLQRINDVADIAKYKFARMDEHPDAVDLSDAPQDIIIAMEATYRLLGEEAIFTQTNLNKKQAGSILRKIKRRFRKNQNGRWSWSYGPPTETQLALIKCLTGVIIGRTAYDSDQFLSETADALIRNSLISSDQKHLLSARRPHLLLFAIQSMHGVRYILRNGDTVEAECGWHRDENWTPRLDVRFRMKIDSKQRVREVTFPLFETDLSPIDYAFGCNPHLPGQIWEMPVELTGEPKLRPI